jgi:hypothetical protein
MSIKRVAGAVVRKGADVTVGVPDRIAIASWAYGEMPM